MTRSSDSKSMVQTPQHRQHEHVAANQEGAAGPVGLPFSAEVRRSGRTAPCSDRPLIWHLRLDRQHCLVETDQITHPDHNLARVT